MRYRFGFNGKENDNEVKGTGNQLDFGARIYDPRLGRWFSPDAMQKDLPSLNPYNFVANNPLRFTDPDGNFLLDVHQRIAQDALKLINGGIASNSKFIEGMIGSGSPVSLTAGITNPDLYHSGALGSNYDASMHFDNLNYLQIIGNLAKVKSLVNSSIDDHNNGGSSAYDLGHDVGVAAHAIQDLYSHSNYIEIYQATYPNQTDVNKIPTIEEALSDPAYAKLAIALRDKDNGLKTGEYPGQGDGSHKMMNHDLGAGSMFGSMMEETKDKSVNWNSIAAEAVAKRATVKLVEDTKNKVKPK